jgi:hypothetical protein
MNQSGGRMIVAQRGNVSCFVLKILVHAIPKFHSGYLPDDSTEFGNENTHGEF